MAQRTVTGLEEGIRARIPPAPAGVPSYRRELAEVVARVVERFQPERVILFGSRAYGSPHAESDVDLMVVADSPLPPREQLWNIRRAVDDSHIPLDIHTRTPAQIRLGLAEHDFFIEDVMSGIALYEREGGELGTTGAGDDGTAGGGSARLKQATQDWLRKSDDDYRAALTLFQGGYPLYDQVCFHAQQSIEKLLKALLQEREIRSRRTHDLVALASRGQRVVPGLVDRKDDLKRLSECAVDPRYPGLDISQEQADDAVAIMVVVRALILPALGFPEPSS